MVNYRKLYILVILITSQYSIYKPIYKMGWLMNQANGPVARSAEYQDALRELYDLMNLEPDSFEGRLRLENGLETAVKEALGITGGINAAGVNIPAENVLGSKAASLGRINQNVADLRDKLPDENYQDLCDQFIGLFNHASMSARDLFEIKGLLGLYSKTQNNILNISGQKSYDVAGYKLKQERKKELAEQEDKINITLTNWAARYCFCYPKIEEAVGLAVAAVDRELKASSERGAEPDYKRVTDVILDFVEAIYLPFVDFNHSYAGKVAYWQAINVLKQRNASSEEIGEFAGRVRDRVKENFTLPDAVEYELHELMESKGGEQ